MPLRVGMAIDNADNPSYGYILVIGDERLQEGELRSGILPLVEHIADVGLHVGYILVTASIVPSREVHKIIEMSLFCYLYNFNFSHFLEHGLTVRRCKIKQNNPNSSFLSI
jgi:hypothetical protein